MTVRMRSSYVDTVIGELHVVRAGSGPQIVLLPAASQSHNAMRHLMTHLAAGGFEVVAVNTPGGGLSCPLPAGATFPVLADAVVEAIRAMALSRPCLYGIHTGNKIAASMAARHAEDISALVFCGQTHSLIADKQARTDRMRLISANRFESDPGDAASQLRGRIALWREIEAMWWGTSPVAARVPAEELVRKRLAITDLLLSLDSLPQLYEANFTYDLEADLRRIEVPTLIVEIATPAEDRAIGRQGETLQRVIGGAELATFEEPDGLGLTLENRAEELAGAIAAFVHSLGGRVPQRR